MQACWAWSLLGSRFAGSTRLPRHLPPACRWGALLSRLGRGAGGQQRLRTGLRDSGPLEAEGEQLLSELTNASKVAVWDSVLALVLLGIIALVVRFLLRAVSPGGCVPRGVSLLPAQCAPQARGWPFVSARAYPGPGCSRMFAE